MGPPPQWQFNTIGFVPMVTGHLSALGSLLIICAGLKNWRKPHMRLLLIMSCYDLLYSLSKAWSILFSPPESGWDLAKGNMASCRAQGFFTQLSHCTGAYNALLSTYNWLTICKGMKEETWLKYEPYLHGSVFIVMTGLGAVAVAIQLYNPILAFCYINSFPPGCESSPESPPCERFPPSQANLLHEVFGQFWIQSYMIIVVITNFLIWHKVHERNHIMDKYDGSSRQLRHRGCSSSSMPGSTDVSAEFTMTPENSSSPDPQGNKKASPSSVITSLRASLQSRFSHSHNHLQEQSRRIQRERAVAMQCLLFTLAFLLSYIGPTIFHLYKWITGERKFSFVLILAIFTPLQGVWNAFIYARPVYPKIKRRYPELYWYQVIWHIFVGHDPMDQSGSRFAQRSLRQSYQQQSQPFQTPSSRSFNEQQQPPPGMNRASFRDSASLDNLNEGEEVQQE